MIWLWLILAIVIVGGNWLLLRRTAAHGQPPKGIQSKPYDADDESDGW